MADSFWTAARIAGVVAIVASGSAAGAQGTERPYPSQPIRVTMAFGAGGPADVMARMIAGKLETNLKVPVIVENKPGASGLLAATAVAGAKPDGYNVLYTAGSSYTIAPALLPTMNIDMHRQFIPVSYGHRQNVVLTVDSQLPMKTLPELVDYAKKNRLNFASPGPGTLPHLTVEILKRRLGLEAEHVPFKSGSEIQRAMLGGEVQFAIDAVPSSLANIQSGRLRAIAVSDTKRIDSLPDVPTFAEYGVDMVIYSWGAMLVPAGTPQAIVSRLHEGMDQSLQDPDLISRMKAIGAEPVRASSQKLRDDAEREMALFAPLVKELGLSQN